MKTPSSSGKKKKKISGVSPSMDLTRFGFSRTKRSSPTQTAPAKNSASSNNAGCKNDDNNLESPLKRQKLSSPVAQNSVGAGSDGKVKGKENGCSTPVDNDKKKAAATTTKISSASRTVLLDLTQSSSSEDGPSIKSVAVTSSNDDNGRKNAGANLTSLGGLANSIASQIVTASSRGKNTNQQIAKQPVKQRRGKRDKITSISNDNKTKSAQQTKPRSNVIKSSPVAKSFSPSKRKGSIYNHNIQALALVRVVNPHEITCSTAVANARRQDQKQSKNNNTKQQLSWTPRRIFNGAILGRSSSSASAKQNFVDLGIGNKCMGISRHHLTVTNVRVKSDASAVVEESQNTLSQTSTASTSTKSSTTSQSEPSSVTIQVNNSASNGINVHRTKRGSRKTTFLKPGEKITLRIGDAVDFYSNQKFYYCVVGLETLQDGIEPQNAGKLVEKGREVVVVEEVEDVPAAKTATTLKKRTSNGNSVSNGREERMKNLSKSSVDDEVEILDVTKSATFKSRASLKTPRNQGSSANTKASAPNSTASVEDEITDTPRFPAASAMSKISPAKCATKMTVGKSPGKRRQKSPMGPKSPQKFASVDANKVTLAVGKDLESTLEKAEQEVESEMIKKGDTVKVRYEVEDWFGESQPEWFFGKVQRVRKSKKSSSSDAYEIDIMYENHEKKTLPYPDEDIEKLESADCHSYPEKFNVGDSVDCYHQDGLRPGHEGRWYRGRIASISDDGDRCDVLYIDGDYESNVPANEKKLRLIKRIDLNGLWMMNKKTTVAVDKSSNVYQYRTGQVTSCDGVQICVTFSDGISESIDSVDVATGVFAHFLKDLPPKDISLWPHSSSSSIANTARLRRQMRDKIAAMKESVLSTKSSAAKKSAPRKNAPTLRAERSANIEMEEPEKPKRDIVRSVMYVPVNLDESSTNTPMKKGKRSVKRLKVDSGRWEEGSPVEDHCTESQESCDNNDLALGKRKAKDFPPGLANIIWSALNSQEPQTGGNLLRNALCVQNIVPPTNFTEKLMDLIKFGPQAEGSSVYFKDPLRTHIASSYACALASSHLVRKDGSAIFGPTSWDDVEVILSLSIDQTENAISGRRLAQGLQMAACGSNLLSVMLKNELFGIDLSSISLSFDSSALKLMPTVKILKSEGLRNVLKAVVRHTTACLVRHSKWILDHDVNGFSSIERESLSCCASEAKDCLEAMGSVLCYTAWLFCVEEGIGIDHPNCAFVIKDEFLTELTRSIENLPEMSSRKQTSFTKNVKLHFVTALIEEFAFPLQDSVGKMIGIGDLLDLF